jgi:hypothetical protein
LFIFIGYFIDPFSVFLAKSGSGLGLLRGLGQINHLFLDPMHNYTIFPMTPPLVRRTLTAFIECNTDAAAKKSVTIVVGVKMGFDFIINIIATLVKLVICIDSFEMHKTKRSNQH